MHIPSKKISLFFFLPTYEISLQHIYQPVIEANTKDAIESNPNQSKKIESMALINPIIKQ